MFSGLMSRCTSPQAAAFCRARGDLPHYQHDQRHVQRPAAIDQLAEVLPLDVLLGDVMDAVFAADFVDLHDVGVHQRSGSLGFVMEAADVRFVSAPTGS